MDIMENFDDEILDIDDIVNITKNYNNIKNLSREEVDEIELNINWRMFEFIKAITIFRITRAAMIGKTDTSITYNKTTLGFEKVKVYSNEQLIEDVGILQSMLQKRGYIAYLKLVNGKKPVLKVSWEGRVGV